VEARSPANPGATESSRDLVAGGSPQTVPPGRSEEVIRREFVASMGALRGGIGLNASPLLKRAVG